MPDDIEALRRLTHDYAWCVDTFNLDGLVELFTEDAVFDGTPTGVAYMGGATAIRDFFQAQFAMTTHMLHVASNQRFDIDGDSARGTVYYIAQARTKDGGDAVGRGYYEDTYVRTAEGWRIRLRKAFALMPPQLEAMSQSPNK